MRVKRPQNGMVHWKCCDVLSAILVHGWVRDEILQMQILPKPPIFFQSDQSS